MHHTPTAVTFIWIGIALCLLNSAAFSGLNLAVFGISRLRLEIEAASGNRAAEKVLTLRRDSHFLLTTILWSNVASNTLLAILSNSILVGVIAFVFSTVVITFVGEILPQAYFSRNALKMASILKPYLRFFQILLYPVAKPSALVLDWWLGREGIEYFREHQIREMIKRHIEAHEADVDRLEGIGAMNFLALDDLAVSTEGEPVDPESVLILPIQGGRPTFPQFDRTPSDNFLQEIQESEKKWVIVTDPNGTPQLVIDSDAFLRAALFEPEPFNPYLYCHRPIIVTDTNTLLGDVVAKLKVEPEDTEDDVVDNDIILIWGDQKRVITGADILGRLLRGIVIREPRNRQ